MLVPTAPRFLGAGKDLPGLQLPLDLDQVIGWMMGEGQVAFLTPLQQWDSGTSTLVSGSS